MFVYLSKSWDYYFSRKFGKLENNKYSVIHGYIHGEEFMLILFSFKGMFSNPGIQRDKTIADKLIYISNDDTQNYPFCRLQSVVETFEHST